MKRTITTRSRGSRLAALVAAMALTLGLTVAAQSPARAEDAPTLKLAVVADTDTFNPFLTILAASININRLQYEGIVNYGKNNELEGGLAEKWETSPDGKVWTYTFPDGRVWSDDQPITADDAAWTFEKIKTDPKLASANGSLLEGIESAVAKDKNTFVITLKAAQAANPALDIPVVPKHVWEKVDATSYAADGSDGQPVVGSGPYYMTKHNKGQSIELKANTKFRLGAPKAGGITYVYYKNTDAAVQGLKAGEVDMVSGLTTAQFTSLKDASNIATVQGAGRRYQGLAINPGAIDIEGKPMGDGNPILKDPKVREALFMAVDQKTIIDKVLGGLGKEGATQIPTIYPDFFGLPDSVTPRKFDIAAANTLLDEAGYPKGSDGIRTDKSGKKIELRLMGRSSDAGHGQMAEFVQAWYKDLGINLKVSMVANTQVNNDSTLGKYDLYFTGWGIGPDPDYQLSINTCASRPNADGSGMTSENNWCDPKFDELYKQQHAELDPAKRADLVKQAFGEIYKANVINVLYYADSLEAYRSDKWEAFTRQPENSGPIYGQNSYWGLYSATPKGGAAASTDDGGLGIGAWIGIGIALAAAVGGVVFVTRRGKSDDKE